jgi:hypothetical protein
MFLLLSMEHDACEVLNSISMMFPKRKIARCPWTQRLFLLLGVLAVSGCVMTNPLTRVQLNVTRHDPFVIQASPTLSTWGYLSHPFIKDLRPHGVLVTFNLGGDAAYASTLEALKDKGPAFTADGGRTWLYGEKAKAAIPFWREGVSLTRGIKDGAAFYFVNYGYLDAVRPGIYRGRGAWITNGLVDAVFDVALHLNAKRGYLSHPGVVMNDGTLHFAAYAKADKDKKFTTFLLTSIDRGKTWRSSEIAEPSDAPWGKDGPCEPALLVLPDQTLLAVMRTDGAGANDFSGRRGLGPMLLARSRDGGQTWEKSRMPAPGVMPKLLRMESGVLVCAFGRPGNSLLFSTDDGRTWGRETVITANKKTSGYIDLVEIEPGRLLVVYDIMNEPLNDFWLWEPEKVNGVVGRYVDVDLRF